MNKESHVMAWTILFRKALYFRYKIDHGNTMAR